MVHGVCSTVYALVRHTPHGFSQSGLVCSIPAQVHYTALALQNMRGEAVELQQASTVLSDNQQGEEGDWRGIRRWQHGLTTCKARGAVRRSARQLQADLASRRGEKRRAVWQP